MSANLVPIPVPRYTDSNGNSLVGGLLYTYAAGTSTPQATYTDSTGVTPCTNPIVLNARGEAAYYLNPSLSYKFVLKDSGGSTIWTADNIRASATLSDLNSSTEVVLASASTVDIGGASSSFVNITGTTGVLSFGTNYIGPRYLRFSGALTITHNAATLILPGGANITTAAGDCCVAIPIGNPSSGWAVESYQRAALAPGAATTATTATALLTGRTIALTGNVTGTTAAFDGSGNVSAATTIAPGVVTPAMLTQPFTGPTVTATTSGITVLLGSGVGAIPSWVKQIDVTFIGVSLSGTSGILVQVSAGSYATSGYLSFGVRLNTGAAGIASTAGFYIDTRNASEAVNGTVTLTKATTGNVWTASGVLSDGTGNAYTVSGSVNLGGVLDGLRLASSNGVDTFDAGSVGFLYK